MILNRYKEVILHEIDRICEQGSINVLFVTELDKLILSDNISLCRFGSLGSGNFVSNSIQDVRH